MPHRPGHTLDSISRQVAPRYSVEGNMGPFGIGPQGGGMGRGQNNWLSNLLSWQIPGSQNIPRYQDVYSAIHPDRQVPDASSLPYFGSAMNFVPGVEAQQMAEQGANPWALAGMMGLDLPVVGLGARGAKSVFKGISNLPQNMGNLLPWDKFRGVPSAGVQRSMGPPYSTPNLSIMGPYLERGRPTVMAQNAAGVPSAFYQSQGTSGQLPHDMIVNRLTNQGVDPTMASQIASDISGKGQFVPTQGFGTVSGQQVGPTGMYNPSNTMSPHRALNAAQALADEGLAPSMFRGDQYQMYDAVKKALRGGFTEQGIDPAVEFMGRYGNDPNLARMGAQITGDLGPQTAEGGFRTSPYSTRDLSSQVPPDMTGITNRMLNVPWGPKTSTPQPKGSLTSPGTTIPAAAAIGGVAAKMPTQDEREGRAQYLAGQNRRRGGL